MPKLDRVQGCPWLRTFWCPGCECGHQVWIAQDPKRPDGPVWSFNGNDDAPTFSPSLLNTWEHGPERVPRRCHLFIRDGKIQFCGDCTHELVGQTVEMLEEWPPRDEG